MVTLLSRLKFKQSKKPPSSIIKSRSMLPCLKVLYTYTLTPYFHDFFLFCPEKRYQYADICT